MANVRHRYHGKEWMEVVDDTRMKHKDYFNFNDLYYLCHEWLVEEGYGGRPDYDFPEHMYLHRETQKSGQENWIWWRCSQEVSKYYRYDFDIDFHIILLKDAEVMVEGKKFKTNWGEVEFKIYAKLVLDYNDEWKNHWLLKHINELFHKRIYFKELDRHRQELLSDVARFKEAVKNFLKLRPLRSHEYSYLMRKKDYSDIQQKPVK